ncbi:hypothetical protein CsSME_00001635 [Camellia sinensis var. sinensis]
MVLLQETKRSSIDISVVRPLCHIDSMEFMAADADSSAGGLLCSAFPNTWCLTGGL